MGANGAAGRAGGGIAARRGVIAARVALAEVLALRTLFLNLQFRQGQGPLTEARCADRSSGPTR